MKTLFEECFEPPFPHPSPYPPKPTDKSPDKEYWIPMLVMSVGILLLIAVISALVYFYKKKKKARIVLIGNTGSVSSSYVTPLSTGFIVISMICY